MHITGPEQQSSTVIYRHDIYCRMLHIPRQPQIFIFLFVAMVETNTDAEEHIIRVMGAESLDEALGLTNGSAQSQRIAFLKLARIIHPDKNKGSKFANAACKKLNRLFNDPGGSSTPTQTSGRTSTTQKTPLGRPNGQDASFLAMLHRVGAELDMASDGSAWCNQHNMPRPCDECGAIRKEKTCRPHGLPKPCKKCKDEYAQRKRREQQAKNREKMTKCTNARLREATMRARGITNAWK